MSLAYIGECKTSKCPNKCPTNYEPVCGNKNITYRNEC